jgi:hypothetical protein
VKTIFKKLGAYFTEEPDLQKAYDDSYNAGLLKQAHLEIVPGIISRAGYFAVEWLLYALALACVFIAWYVWTGPLDGFLYHLTERAVSSAVMNKDMMTMYDYTCLLFLLLPALLFFILARVSRAKHIQLQKLAAIAKKIDEVAQNLTYRVEHKSARE